MRQKHDMQESTTDYGVKKKCALNLREKFQLDDCICKIENQQHGKSFFHKIVLTTFFNKIKPRQRSVSRSCPANKNTRQAHAYAV